MKENFEFDKIIIAVAVALLIIIMSANIGSMIYVPNLVPLKKGFKVDIAEINSGGQTASQGLPEEIDIIKVMENADPSAGKQVFSQCAVCHTIDKGGANKVGPNLWGVVGANTARVDNFAYSSAMNKRKDEGGKWDLEALYRYLYAPKQYVPGTKMAFAGVKKDKDRTNLIAYLNTMSDHPLPISS